MCDCLLAKGKLKMCSEASELASDLFEARYRALTSLDGQVHMAANKALDAYNQHVTTAVVLQCIDTLVSDWVGQFFAQHDILGHVIVGPHARIDPLT